MSIKVFISYAHADQELRKKLEEHLSALKYSGKIAIWQDQEIPAGANWEDQINNHLNEADMILLLISASFIASKYCWNREVQSALKRHKAGTVQIIPIILKAVDWLDTPLGQLQALPTEAKPVTRWEDQDTAFEDVVRGIRDAVEDLLSKKLSPDGVSRSLPDSSHPKASRRVVPLPAEQARTDTISVRCSLGHGNPNGSTFCEECGEPLQAAIPAATPAGTQVCPSCGATNPAGKYYCFNCGISLAERINPDGFDEGYASPPRPKSTTVPRSSVPLTEGISSDGFDGGYASPPRPKSTTVPRSPVPLTAYPSRSRSTVVRKSPDKSAQQFLLTQGILEEEPKSRIKPRRQLYSPQQIQQLKQQPSLINLLFNRRIITVIVLITILIVILIIIHP